MFREGYEVTTELVEVLIVALEREMRLQEEGRSPDPYLEMDLGLRHAVSATRHPLTVDILLRALWGGSDVLLMFGPDMVLPRAVEMARSPEATPYEARQALRVLEDAVERWDETLGPEIREAMKEVAILHLEGPPDSFASAREAMRDFARVSVRRCRRTGQGAAGPGADGHRPKGPPPLFWTAWNPVIDVCDCD